MSDEDGNINPYATFPRPAGSPPGRFTSQSAAGPRRPLTSFADNAPTATNDGRPVRLDTVRISSFAVSTFSKPGPTSMKRGVHILRV